MRFHRKAKTTVTVVTLGIAAGLYIPAHAAVVTSGCADVNVSCSLAELFGIGTITVNDKKFSDFSLDFTAPGSKVLNFDEVKVSGLDDGGADPGPGLRVSSTTEFLISDLDLINFVYAFRVDVTDPLWRVKDNSLTVDATPAGYTLTSGDPTTGPRWEVNEAVNTLGLTEVLGSKQVFADGFLGTSNLSDAAVFAPQTSLLVGTNVYMEGFGTDDSAQLFAFEQRFSQTMVPLPAPLLLLVTGIASLIGFGHRRPSTTNFPALP